RAFERVIAIDPKHAEAYNYVGYMYAERGQNLDEAISLIGQALSLEPDNGYFIDSLGWAYYQQGKYPDALRELKRAVEKAKEDPLAAWEKSLSLDPNADGVKQKVQDAKSRLRRAQGERSKAAQ